MVSCLHSFFRKEKLTSVYWETYLSVFWFAWAVGRVNRAGSRGIFSWHCCREGSSPVAQLWRGPGSNKLHTEFLKIRGLLLQMKMYSSLHLDTAQQNEAVLASLSIHRSVGKLRPSPPVCMKMGKGPVTPI